MTLRHELPLHAVEGDPGLFAASLAYDRRDVEEDLALIELTRKQMARILRALKPEDFQRQGGHSRDGPLTLEVLVQRVTAHIPHHVRFIEERGEPCPERENHANGGPEGGIQWHESTSGQRNPL